MALFTISDLHLCVANPEKTMEEFAGRWNNYIARLCKNWNAVVSPKDSVIIPGDISWALGLQASYDDLKLIDSLNGTKYIGKGNHDLWWATMSKMNSFFEINNFKTLRILYNNAYKVENKIICGTRGWFYDERLQKTVEPTDYQKIIIREAGRLKLGLEMAKKINEDDISKGEAPKEIMVFFHFPPVWEDFVCNEFISLMKEYGVRRCFYGHIHGNYDVPFKKIYDCIEMYIVSADYLSFLPYLIR